MDDVEIDLDERSASFDLPKSAYSRESVEIAAHVFASRADVLLAESSKELSLTLRAKRKGLDRAGCEALAGEFVNELLNQEYRRVVGRFNQKITSVVVTQTLLAARGGEKPAEAPEAEKTPEFQAAVEKLMEDARLEISRTMPKKISPQGTPLPPVQEEAGA